MKKFGLLAAIGLLAITGCGRSWMPFSCLNRGDQCYDGACAPVYGAPIAMDSGCTDCESSVSYGAPTSEYVPVPPPSALPPPAR